MKSLKKTKYFWIFLILVSCVLFNIRTNNDVNSFHSRENGPLSSKNLEIATINPPKEIWNIT